MRTFTDNVAVREQVPLIMGLVGPTGSGKTGSALEIALGLQDIFGGDIGFVDSEARRALAYADAPSFSDPKRRFKFRHIDFKAPFGPLDYKAAGEHYIKAGVRHIIFDSTSHMWEGTGGVLQIHEAEAKRLAEAWKTSPSQTNFPAWNKAKTEQTDFVNWMKQQPINFIFCFRGKEKLKMVDKKPVEAGWQAIGGEDLLYEMSLACLLLPGCDGQPIWNKQEEKGVKALPAHFRPMFADNPRLSINVGRKLAEWAKGAPIQAPAKDQPPIQAPAAKPAQAPIQPPKPKNDIAHATTSDGTSAMDWTAKLMDCTSIDALGVEWKKLYACRGLLTEKEFNELVGIKDQCKALLSKPVTTAEESL